MCTIIGVKNNKGETLIGRNFDFIQHGGNIHFVPPTRSYGLKTYGVFLIEQMGLDRPYEGMNEEGLFIGMNAVEDSKIKSKNNTSMNDMGLIKFVLERTKSVENALKLVKKFNIDYMKNNGYPKIHYFIADKLGNVAVYEEDYYESCIDLEKDKWTALTNFTGKNKENCQRFNTVKNTFQKNIIEDSSDLFNLLENVKQNGHTFTAYSCVYNLDKKEISICIEQNYNQVYNFNLLELINRHSIIDFGELKLRSMLEQQASIT